MPEISQVVHSAGGVTPVAVLHYMDTRLAAHMARIEAVLKEHTVEEMERYREIVDGIRISSENAVDRHATLLAQLSVQNTRTDLLDTAFPLNEKGQPDFVSHKIEHIERKKWGDWIDGTKRSMTGKVLEWGAITFVAYLVIKVAPSLMPTIMAPGM